MKKRMNHGGRVMILGVIMVLAVSVNWVCAEEDNPPAIPDMPTGVHQDIETDDETPTEVSTPQTLKTTVKQTTALISSRISQVVAPVPEAGRKFRKPIFNLSANEYGTGISAGDEEQQKFGLWGNFALTGSESEYSLTESDFDLYNFIIGTDYKFTDKIVAGLSLSYELLDGTTAYNAGDMELDGFTLSPYFAVLINDFLSFDISAGYSWVNIDQKRNKDGSKVPGQGTISSSLDAERMFISVNTSSYYIKDRWILSANLGYLYAEEDQDAYRETNSNKVPENTVRFAQVSIGTEISYAFDSTEPYLNLGFEYDTTYDEEIGVGEEKVEIDHDPSGFVVGGGLRFLMFSFLQGDIQASKIFGRNDYDEYSVMANLRFEF
jgi:hypothetical protein